MRGALRKEDLPDEVKLALATFGMLALELAVIRWLSGQIRIFAYLNNLVLIGAFLGIGLGVALAERRPGLRSWVLPSFFGLTALVMALHSAGWTRLTFPDLSVHLWGAEVRAALGTAARSLAAVLFLFAVVVACFVPTGAAVGHFFRRLPTLRAYSFDLLGSLVGVLAIAAVTAQGSPPVAWFIVGAAPFLILAPSLIGAVSLAGIVLATWLSGGNAFYSPYNRIDLTTAEGDLVLSVNRDFHQYMHDLSDERIAAEEDEERRQRRILVRAVYDLPYQVGDDRGRALIIGAGGGNDARAAIRNGYDSVWAVDIDPRILELGERLHPERPYADPRVVRVVNDARAFLEQYRGEPFDVVSYGFLDSHAMFSAMSSLRLENYVYTEEGIRAAWELVGDDGHMAIAFSVLAGPWIRDRLYWTVARATGREPVVVAHDLYEGNTFLVSRGELTLPPDLPFDVARPQAEALDVRVTSDDWPFLYLRPASFPWAYALVLLLVLVGAFFATRRVFGREVTGKAFDAPLFFMGAAFLLLETRGITNLSLLFGSTWVVNTAVFSGILATALVANLLVERYPPRRESIWFVPLFLSLALLWAIPASRLTGLPLIGRGVVGGILVGLPVGFAGVIVSARLKCSANPTASLGSNLLGAVLGGCLEYLSMWLGLQALLVLAATLYLLAMGFLRRQTPVWAANPTTVPHGARTKTSSIP